MTESKSSPGLSAGETIETTRKFLPKFASDGLIPAIVVDVQSGDVLMFAHMNEEALRRTLETGVAHFWSRSRSKLWKKGEESGNFLKVREVRTDCDQDVLCLSVEVGGEGVVCHTGAVSCFYRRVAAAPDGDGTVLEIAAPPHAREPG
jgi:phosphoribosyl-AMP cyclohydrolase